jgi:hypothetical protein
MADADETAAAVAEYKRKLADISFRHHQKEAERMFEIVRSGTVTPPPVQDSQHPSPSFGRLRSKVLKEIWRIIAEDPDASNRHICGLLDMDEVVLTGKARSGSKKNTFVAAYLDPDRKNLIESMISKVRRRMREAGMLAVRHKTLAT